ncbi:MAG: histidine kinase [Cellulomonadaceae bacterium]|jgi:signal transduction histidine kinase|nr:histidine kinase [Cellulomonadaceae bacterium]
MTWREFRAWSTRHRFALDAAFALWCALVVIVLAGAVTGTASSRASQWGATAWSLAVVLPLAWRRTRPVASTAVIAVAALVHLIAGYPVLLPADLAVLLSLYSVTVYGPRWASRAAMSAAGVGAALLGIVVGAGSQEFTTGAGTTVMALALSLAAWALGLTRRSRRETIDALRDRARRLEIERDQQAQLATAAERARIAREMHDIVAHSLTVVIAQADGGRYAAAHDGEAAGRALTVIADTSRAALADMRRLLGVLRSDDNNNAPLTPAQVGGEDITGLVAQAREAGMSVALTTMGTPRPLAPGMNLTLYRVVQEALSNVRKHAGPGVSVTVAMTWGTSAIEVEVSDDGRGAASTDAAHSSNDTRPSDKAGTSAGFGLMGMRERVEMFGGTVNSGPRPGGGWRVRASLPTSSTSTTVKE